MDNHVGATAPNREAPPIEKRKVPVRRANAAYRRREYLLEQEIQQVQR